MHHTPGAHARDDDGRDRRRDRRRKAAAAFLGALLAGVGAYAASNWAVGLNSGSSGESQSAAAAANLTITASAAPAATNLLYPGSTGDVVVTIANANAYPVTITALALPTNTTYATGYTASALTTANLNANCTSANSAVAYAFATGTSGTSHTLTSPLTVAANNSLVVTFTNDATMGTTSPVGCEATWFQMPSFTGVTASVGGTATTSPVTDAWTS